MLVCPLSAVIKKQHGLSIRVPKASHAAAAEGNTVGSAGAQSLHGCCHVGKLSPQKAAEMWTIGSAPRPASHFHCSSGSSRRCQLAIMPCSLFRG